jgi:hypothetical protein
MQERASPASRRVLAATISLFALPTIAPAQSVRHESLTDWVHTGGPPAWTDDVPNTGAEFGKVDQLNASTDLTFTSGTLLLNAGTFRASARLAKFQDAVGAAPIDFLVLLNGQPVKQVTLPVADQTIDQFVRTPELTFSVLVPNTAVRFLLLNTDPTVTKQNYWFDSFQLGEIDQIGPVLLIESLGRSWSKSWGQPYFLGMQPDPSSIYASSELLAYVWWLDWHSKTIVLQPGTYTCNVRARKNTDTGGSYPLDLKVVIGGVTQSVTWTVAEQVVNRYVWTQDLAFDVTQPNTQVQFRFEDIVSGLRKANYSFDAFALRSGAYSTTGAACASSLGPVTIHGNPPQIGEPFTVRVRNVPSNGALLYGLRSQAIDLTAIGMNGCFLYTTPDATLGIQGVNGVAEATFVVPANPALAGGVIYNQAVVFAPGQNTLGLVASNRGKGEISR